MTETQLAAGGKLSLIAAHPIATAVVGGLLLGAGAYYLGKALAKRAQDKAENEEAEATVDAQAEPAAA